MSTDAILWLGVAMAVGAFVQGTVGFGLAVVASPFVIFTEPALMPGSIIIATFVVPIVELLVGPRDIAWRPLGWALIGRLALTPVGVGIVAWLSPDLIGALVGLLILTVVALTIRRWRIAATGRNALAAGAVTGVSATAGAIGGPFFALVLQHERPARIRSTLAVFFVVGVIVSLLGLWLGGTVTNLQVRVGLIWVPFVLAGFALSFPARRKLDQGMMRRGVLAFCAVAGASVLIRTILVHL